MLKNMREHRTSRIQGSGCTALIHFGDAVEITFEREGLSRFLRGAQIAIIRIEGQTAIYTRGGSVIETALEFPLNGIECEKGGAEILKKILGSIVLEMISADDKVARSQRYEDLPLSPAFQFGALSEQPYGTGLPFTKDIGIVRWLLGQFLLAPVANIANKVI